MTSANRPPERGRLARILAAFLLSGGLGLVFVAPLLGVDGGRLAGRWLAAAHGPMGLPAAVVVFAALAFIGVPQVLLIAACVAAFGPLLGGVYSWVATLVSASIGYALGRAYGAPFLEGLHSDRLQRFTALLARNGFLASLVVRLVPAAPFAVVNMLAGAARIRPSHFVAGAALGIIPKITAVALGGLAIVNWLSAK